MIQVLFRIYHEDQEYRCELRDFGRLEFGITSEDGRTVQFSWETFTHMLFERGLLPGKEGRPVSDRARYRAALAVIRAGAENPVTIAVRALAPPESEAGKEGSD